MASKAFSAGRIFKWIPVLAGMAFLSLFPLRAEAARISGGYLLRICSSDAKGQEVVKGGHAACQAYIAGVVDYHNLIRTLGAAPTTNFCVPRDVTMYDLQHLMVAYLSKNKQHDTFIAAPAVAIALYEAYPCGRSKKK